MLVLKRIYADTCIVIGKICFAEGSNHRIGVVTPGRFTFTRMLAIHNQHCGHMLPSLRFCLRSGFRNPTLCAVQIREAAQRFVDYATMMLLFWLMMMLIKLDLGCRTHQSSRARPMIQRATVRPLASASRTSNRSRSTIVTSTTTKAITLNSSSSTSSSTVPVQNHQKTQFR